MSELFSGLDRLGIECHALCFMPRSLVSHLLQGPNVTCLTRLLSHVTRAKFFASVDASWLPGWVKALAKRGYAVVDYVYGYYFTIVIYWLIRRRGIQLLHLNNALNVNGLRAATWAEIPCVAHMRGIIGENTRHVLDRYARIAETALKRAVVISTAVMESGVRAGMSPERLELIHNSVDVSKFGQPAIERDSIRAKYGLGDADVVFGIFGRIIGWKGQLELIQAMTPLMEQDRNTKIMIVGDNSDSVGDRYSEQVAELARRPEFHGQIVLTGYQADVISYYHACDVVVHNSIQMEPFGRVVIEAMACAKPVIAMDEGGPCDIIDDGVDGLLVTPRSPVALRQAVQRLLDDGELRKRIGANARLKVEREFDTTQIAARVASMYRAIFAERRADGEGVPR